MKPQPNKIRKKYGSNKKRGFPSLSITCTTNDNIKVFEILPGKWLFVMWHMQKEKYCWIQRTTHWYGGRRRGIQSEVPMSNIFDFF